MTACPIRYQRQVSDRKGKIFYTSITSLSHISKKAGVRKLNFHALRHTFATRALECGMDIKTLSELMGHKNATITLNRYAHSMMDTKIAAMNKLEKLF